MKIITTWISISLLTIAVVAACGKQDKEDGDQGGAAAKGGEDRAPAGASDAPDKAAVAGMDCTKACTVQFDCAKKNGMLHPQAKLSDCTMGCDMIKSMYDPAKHAIPAKQMLSYAAGSCD